jgi:enoyl-CoA hydratase/carnithine racemase
VTLARELSAGAWLVPARAKSLLRETAGSGLGEGIAREREVATELFATPDGREGFAAFTQHRAPAFAPGQPS